MKNKYIGNLKRVDPVYFDDEYFKEFLTKKFSLKESYLSLAKYIGDSYPFKDESELLSIERAVGKRIYNKAVKIYLTEDLNT